MPAKIVLHPTDFSKASTVAFHHALKVTLLTKPKLTILSVASEGSEWEDFLMRRFKSAGHAQRFLSVFGIITSHFRVGRHLHKASGYRELMKSRFALWEEAICVEAIVN